MTNERTDFLLVSELKEKLNLEYITKGDKDNEISGCYIGDMLSVVMSRAEENSVWLTVQTNVNITAVAVLARLACIIIVDGMELQEDTLKRANEQGISILKTDKTAYETACLINALL